MKLSESVLEGFGNQINEASKKGMDNARMSVMKALKAFGSDKREGLGLKGDEVMDFVNDNINTSITVKFIKQLAEEFDDVTG